MVADSSVAWLLACAAALLLFASVILHELGHALVARRYGLPVHAITLFALGGVTEIADAPPEPVRDFLVAVAGPAVSLLLALLGGLAWWAARAPLASAAAAPGADQRRDCAVQSAAGLSARWWARALGGGGFSDRR